MATAVEVLGESFSSIFNMPSKQGEYRVTDANRGKTSSHTSNPSSSSSSSSSTVGDSTLDIGQPPQMSTTFPPGGGNSFVVPSSIANSQMFHFDTSNMESDSCGNFATSSLGSFMRSLCKDGAPVNPPSSTSMTSESNGQSSTYGMVSGGNSGSSSALVPSSDRSSISDAQLMLSNPISAGSGDQQYVEITEYLNMPQYAAAKKLGIPASTLSKRWKEAVRTRKWPFRTVQKLDKEITTLLHNVPQGPDAPPLPKDIESTLGQLLRRRQEELSAVIIRI